MRLVITRPAVEAERWLARWPASNVPVQLVRLPLIDILALADSGEARRCRVALAAGQFVAAMFVSANAAAHFLEAGAAWPASTRAWATGPGTVAALRAAGVPAHQIDQPAADASQLDSEHLWARVQHQALAGQRVLIVRGAGSDGQIAGRDWLARQIEASGATVQEIAAYQRRAPTWGPAQQAEARALLQDADAAWLFSSSEAVANLSRLLDPWPGAKAQALATHPRIAEAARAAGFGRVMLTQPHPDAVLASIESPQ
jgi:uroporphyrinogen-III synthase